MNMTSGRAERAPRKDAQAKPSASATRCQEKNSQIPGSDFWKNGLIADRPGELAKARYPVA